VPRPRLLLPLLVLAFGGAAAPAYGAATVYQSIDAFRTAVQSQTVNWDDQQPTSDLPTDSYASEGMVLGSPGEVVDSRQQSQFAAYSPPNIFQTSGSTVTTVSFLVPGSTTPGVSRGFGAEFSNATSGASKIELLDSQDKVIGTAQAQGQAGTLSFLGLAFSDARVVRARITAGTAEGTTMLDDFVFGKPVADQDRDGVPDSSDNCPTVANPDQSNVDKDSMGDACDPDADNDGVPNSRDAFPLDRTESVDTDGDGIGDNKDPDDDNDGLSDATEGRIGTDPKRADTDGDGVPDGQDNCPLTPNADQADSNGDGRGDACSDSVPPVVSSLKLKPPRFRIGSKNGTRVSFRLSEAAAVRLTVVELLAGHRSGSRCLKGAPTKDKKGRTRERPCTFSKAMRGEIQRAASGGTNFAKFDGRIGGRWISPGRYALIAGATDTAGNPARKSPSAAFTILP
jgi:hypothetical protein